MDLQSSRKNLKTQMFQYEIKLALYSKGLIKNEHLNYAYLCEYTGYDEDEDTAIFSRIKDFEPEKIHLNETLSLQYKNSEIISGLLVYQRHYYGISKELYSDFNFLNDTYPHIPFVFENKQYMLVIDGNVST
jgi:hypothetical protein